MAEISNVAPLTPPDCDLRGLEWMPLDVTRLMDSDMFALSTGDEFKAAVALWARSWNQVPAASLPDDDRVLAHLSGAGSRWKKVRKMALHGWILCSDGRLYHKTVAEKAREAWARRLKERERKNKWRTEKIEKSGEVDGDETGTGRGQDADGTRLSPMTGPDRTGPEIKKEEDPPVIPPAEDEIDDWPSGHDGTVLARPPSNHRGGGARTTGDVLDRFMRKTGPPEKRLKLQSKADTEMANWLMTREGKNTEEAWRVVQIARDEDHPEHLDRARYLEKLSRQHRLGWFAEESA